MKTFVIVFSIFLFLSNGINAQNGSVDCSQYIKSELLKRDMHYSIYLPEGYDKSNRSYPVLYLLHGMWDNYTGWVKAGELNRTAGKLIAKGDIPEMIIIMPDGLTDAFYINNFDNSVKWEDFFYKEFIPQIEKKYRIIDNRNNRAIAGLSMGGYGSLYHAITHKEMFGTCYALSAAVLEMEPIKDDKRNQFEKTLHTRLWGPLNTEGYPENYKKYSVIEIVNAMPPLKQENQFGNNSALPFITLDCGDDDFLLLQNLSLAKVLKEKNIPFNLRIREGAHTWDYWRTNLQYALKTVGESFRK